MNTIIPLKRKKEGSWSDFRKTFPVINFCRRVQEIALLPGEAKSDPFGGCFPFHILSFLCWQGKHEESLPPLLHACFLCSASTLFCLSRVGLESWLWEVRKEMVLTSLPSAQILNPN